MKKLLSFILVLLMCSPLALADIDLSGLSFEELAKLRDQCQYEMWQRNEWQEVRVPQGIWEVGVDIPAGEWTVMCADEGLWDFAYITIGSKLNINKTEIEYSWDTSTVMIYKASTNNDNYKGNSTSANITLVKGQYIDIAYNYCAVIFTPYTGKPSLGFK